MPSFPIPVISSLSLCFKTQALKSRDSSGLHPLHADTPYHKDYLEARSEEDQRNSAFADEIKRLKEKTMQQRKERAKLLKSDEATQAKRTASRDEEHAIKEAEIKASENSEKKQTSEEKADAEVQATLAVHDVSMSSDYQATVQAAMEADLKRRAAERVARQTFRTERAKRCRRTHFRLHLSRCVMCCMQMFSRPDFMDEENCNEFEGGIYSIFTLNLHLNQHMQHACAHTRIPTSSSVALRLSLTLATDHLRQFWLVGCTFFSMKHLAPCVHRLAKDSSQASKLEASMAKTSEDIMQPDQLINAARVNHGEGDTVCLPLFLSALLSLLPLSAILTRSFSLGVFEHVFVFFYMHHVSPQRRASEPGKYS